MLPSADPLFGRPPQRLPAPRGAALARRSPLLLVCLLFVRLAAPPVPAQERGWDLPLRGAVEYRRVTQPVVIAPPAYDRRSGIHYLVAAAGQGGHAWTYRQFGGGLGADGWTQPDYDDRDWRSGHTPFGDRGQRTAWPADQRFLDARATFESGRRKPRAAVLQVSHDDGCQVWLNGVKIYQSDRYLTNQWITLSEEALDAFEGGRNVLSARVENTGGASFFDLGLTICNRSFRAPDAAINLVRSRARQASRLRSGLFPAFRSPPFLCQGQLDEDQERLARPPVDLRDLGPMIAWDLSRTTRRHDVDGELPRMFRFGDVHYGGRAYRTRSDGLQRMQARVTTRLPESRGQDRRYVERYVEPHYSHQFEGEIEIERRLDLDRQVVEWFRYELRGAFVPRRGSLAGREFQLSFTEEWRLAAIHENRDVWFKKAVIDAIAKGVGKLKKELANPGRRELKNQPRGSRTYNSGRLALGLLALLHAEVPHDDPVVKRLIAELRKRRLYDTYSTAHAIMAMETYYAPRGEFEDLRSGVITTPYERRLSKRDLALVKRWTKTLLRNIDTRVDRGYLLRFNYTRGRRYDNSVNQYGLLGLYSAHLCGVDISSTVWEAAANHLIDDQQRPEGRRSLSLISYPQWATLQNGGDTSTGDRSAMVAGWGYQGPSGNGLDRPIYGSMTCAGIAGLTICLAGLRDQGINRSALVGYAERAVRWGFAWLAENFTVHSNARRYHQPYYWVYYYLYGLERACELSGVALLDGRDWYYEGALTLISAQQGDGGWRDDLHPDQIMERTAMAILFLKKASMPVYTNR